MTTDVVDFLNSFEDSGVIKIKILGHTGRSIVAPIDRFAAGREAAGIDRRVEIQILLRDKGAESPRRRAQIIFAEEHANSLIQKYPWLKIEVRYYSALQTLRGTIVRLADGSKRALFSAYEWTLKPQPIQGQDRFQPIRTAAVTWSKSLQSHKSSNHEHNRLLSIVENWFDYYWGPGLIHTIAFDFDDTIIDTYEAKIKAWIFGIEQLLREPQWAEYLALEFRRSFEASTEARFSLLKGIVDSVPHASDILKNVLRSAPSEIEDFLDKKRSTFRREALFPPQMSKPELEDYVNSKVFPGVKEAFQEIRGRGYSIAVASLTDEERIESALKLAGIPHVGIIVGRNEYQDRELKGTLRTTRFF
ncbi:HAD hydrolase-like protein [Bradyrhizobium japonicum]|uniref:HAD hydrolase-like protein n=1 Tax=Bradyrhizobium japonicum TaxID=375 RepID=UPI00048381DA|nr:HAD family hydrolase [Bradyrhizobium japonicum]MCP1747571.1 phosphoglycolate phosphatase-like HAD superfamily hydrolase [Bradyrhizobium japonicum]MCP1865153.1 phosphoglycolate phosphatase-like HAD superfamily hydrolase [Bradyrhizobium japonicum]MCP1896074.1 phosphoglycolate phosphatase-like HAD superfamily hydrolase [Bradyrhizobium japonicum]MCW2329460.1 phosphoglycolate phosphatase-like HAD superfamily hydrolase [Bradyrhizobium japonicum]WLB97052.1 HAD hydrolase-like protein [Bradyrhizobiu